MNQSLPQNILQILQSDNIENWQVINCLPNNQSLIAQAFSSQSVNQLLDTLQTALAPAQFWVFKFDASQTLLRNQHNQCLPLIVKQTAPENLELKWVALILEQPNLALLAKKLIFICAWPHVFMSNVDMINNLDVADEIRFQSGQSLPDMSLMESEQQCLAALLQCLPAFNNTSSATMWLMQIYTTLKNTANHLAEHYLLLLADRSVTDNAQKQQQQIPLWGQKLLAAMSGLFDALDGKNSVCGEQTLTGYCLYRRPYKIRPALTTDMPQLLMLEEKCWQHTRMNKEHLLLRMQNFSAGQLVIEQQGRVVGAVYCQKISDKNQIDLYDAYSVHQLHDAHGQTIQLLAINIDPQVQNQNLGDQLLEFLLQLATLMPEIREVVGVTLCKKFYAAANTDFSAYIRQTGYKQDPVLAFHCSHGAQVEKAIANYRPDDFINQHFGVLVSYQLAQRQACQLTYQQSKSMAATRNNLPAIEQIEQQFVRSVAQLLNSEMTPPMYRIPLMELGLDSADLLLLQQMLNEQFALQLNAGFFFQFNSVQKVITHLTEKIAQNSHPKVALSESGQFEQTELYSERQIAIIGIACHLPGGIKRLDQLWQLLKEEKNAIIDFPQFRGSWPAETDYKAITRGGFLNDADQFDAGFFRLSPIEAINTDPQQRILLQLAWQCMQDAAINPENLEGSQTGVYVGASNTDYSRLIQAQNTPTQAHFATGSSLAVLANRISYFFDFSGPSLVIDTACSASMVALHTAIRALRFQECEQALVGGVNLICDPALSIAYHKAGMLSADGQCKVFDTNANGYVRSEGAVMLMLKSLPKAIADGNPIHAVIEGSAINHGGLAGGLTVPNPEKQSELILQAWRDAQISASDVGYIEAHGTGTSLGDPIEIQGIQMAFAAQLGEQPLTRPCMIGSIKSNLGHLEAAAGLAGVIKAVICLKQRQIPASLQIHQLSEKLDFNPQQLQINQRLHNWQNEARRIAGVSSFGSGGANGHVVLSEYLASNEYLASTDKTDDLEIECTSKNHSNNNKVAYLIVLSAPEHAGLIKLVSQLVNWLSSANVSLSLASLAYTLQVARSSFPCRLAIVTTDEADLIGQLKHWLTDAKDNLVQTKFSQENNRDTKQEINQEINQIAKRWLQGDEVDFTGLYKNLPALIHVPAYPFNQQSFWVKTNKASSQLKPSSYHTESHHPVVTDTFTETFKEIALVNCFQQGRFTCLSLSYAIELLTKAIQKFNQFAQLKSDVLVFENIYFYPCAILLGQKISFVVEMSVSEKQLELTIQQNQKNRQHRLLKAIIHNDKLAQSFDVSQTDWEGLADAANSPLSEGESTGAALFVVKESNDGLPLDSQLTSSFELKYQLPRNTFNQLLPRLVSQLSSHIYLPKLTLLANIKYISHVNVAIQSQRISLFNDAKKLIAVIELSR
ncbi:beta-ketoacyl synthase N-terminal-like domain-containing protein [Aliikangiella maris]|uniref:Beta-ketoacyl synthase N-terminal-like domain-containing protein n=2 Tax=Aliikangiella maris TaxID=3162458 RepID=A0ABV2BXX9_9GAMM